jgi:hypothetical protein
MHSAWSLWHPHHQKPRGLISLCSSGLRLGVAVVLFATPYLLVAQQPVPIPSFQSDAPPTPAPATPSSPPATISPASGTVVIVPSTPANTDGAGSAASPAFQQPPVKASVKLDSGKLTVRAKNSSLSQILRDIAGATGMKVDGFSRDERVFGNFGPDEPHQVLSSLLDGSGYNVIMVGDTDKGTPRVLSLSPRSKPGQPDVAPETPALAASDDDGEQMTDDSSDAPPDQPIPAPTSIPAPDAAAQQAAPTDDDNTVRTPQQILEELQRLHPPDPSQSEPQPSPPPQQ